MFIHWSSLFHWRPQMAAQESVLLVLLMIAEFSCLWLSIASSAAAASTFFKPFNVSYDHRAIIIDGRRRLLVSGGIHYPRATPQVLCSLYDLSLFCSFRWSTMYWQLNFNFSFGLFLACLIPRITLRKCKIIFLKYLVWLFGLHFIKIIVHLQAIRNFIAQWYIACAFRRSLTQ